MNNNLFKELSIVLLSEKDYISSDGELLKNKVYQSALNMDSKLLSLLLSNDILRDNFFVKVNNNYVFDKVQFGWILNNKDWRDNNE